MLILQRPLLLYRCGTAFFFDVLQPVCNTPFSSILFGSM